MVIKYTEAAGQGTPNEVYNLYPDQYVSEDKKFKKEWIKINMDYFSNVAYSQYMTNEKEIKKNYKLLKGILTREDFYDEPEVASFTETLTKNMELPAHVKHYPIMNPPINTMMGELSRRPDNHRVKAFDDDSKSEELQDMTQVMQDFIM